MSFGVYFDQNLSLVNFQELPIFNCTPCRKARGYAFREDFENLVRFSVYLDQILCYIISKN